MVYTMLKLEKIYTYPDYLVFSEGLAEKIFQKRHQLQVTPEKCKALLQPSQEISIQALTIDFYYEICHDALRIVVLVG